MNFSCTESLGGKRLVIVAPSPPQLLLPRVEEVLVLGFFLLFASWNHRAYFTKMSWDKAVPFFMMREVQKFNSCGIFSPGASSRSTRSIIRHSMVRSRPVTAWTYWFGAWMPDLSGQALCNEGTLGHICRRPDSSVPPPTLFLASGDDTHTHTQTGKKKTCKLLIKAFASASQNICITESSAQFKVCGVFDRSGPRLSSGLVLPLFSWTQSERERWIMSSLNARQSAAAGVGGTVTNVDRKLLWNILKVLINQPLRPRPNLSAPQCASVDSTRTRAVVTSQPLQNESARLTERPDHPRGPT